MAARGRAVFVPARVACAELIATGCANWTALFLDRKPVSGAGGLEMTREMQLVIAAQACLLVLNLDLELYDDWVEVIVYPDEFVADHEYMSEDGVDAPRVERAALG